MRDLSNPLEPFPLGRLLATPGVLRLGIDLLPFLRRHARGDWGDVDPEDLAANDRALQEGSRILSVYRTDAGTLWIITEADRAATTVLLPEDY